MSEQPHRSTSRWTALSGDQPRVEAPASPPPTPLPIYGNWQEAWQDDHGQWHAPWQAHVPVPQGIQQVVPAAPAIAAPPADPAPRFVAPQELAPVGPPLHAAPARAARDPRRTTMAAVITFVSLLVGLWAILGFVDSLSTTLGSLASGNKTLRTQLVITNDGLDALERSTSSMEILATDTGTLGAGLQAMAADMGGMLEGVGRINTELGTMNRSLTTLDSELQRVNATNASLAQSLQGIDTGLRGQLGSVRTLNRDIAATGSILRTLGPRLDATNGRLLYTNEAVRVMGCQGITSTLAFDVTAGPFNAGSATVYATVVPPGAWGTQRDQVTPC